jgi:flagellar biosynthesis/type III secretory pathway chaperone
MSNKLAKLEQMIACLEKAAGLNPDYEVIKQRDDGSWPEPKTTAALIVERVNFKDTPELCELRQRNCELAHKVEDERCALERVSASPLGQRIRLQHDH